MLGFGSYLLGVVQILALAGFAWLGGSSIRSWLVPDLAGAPAHLAASVVALALLIWSGELLGTFGAFKPIPYLLVVGALGAGTWALCRRGLSEDQGGAAGQAVLDPPDPLPPAGGAPSIRRQQRRSQAGTGWARRHRRSRAAPPTRSGAQARGRNQPDALARRRG